MVGFVLSSGQGTVPVSMMLAKRLMKASKASSWGMGQKAKNEKARPFW
ncbi:hypothetical protein CEV33_0876 [Brucella grignonensis]|uniref:Uncharacterized protein n=1 Tax=Brucella grignonensis TaxID=94627 RepID=A0A256FE55_9HYPH|nr:hypothetical protein CEV33_0876 [Brucella grignonensis]